MRKYVLVPIEEYKSLQDADSMLTALTNCGVDSWSNYKEAIEEYKLILEEYPIKLEVILEEKEEFIKQNLLMEIIRD